jgi:hypothetical protein
MTTRIDNAASRAYIQALEHRGINGRMIPNQTDMADFCFLKQASKELVGNARSTFIFWAAYLGNTTPRVRMYSVDSTDKETSRMVRLEYQKSNFTHPKLQRFESELYRSEEVDAQH